MEYIEENKERATSRFSWGRVWQLALFYRSSFLRQLALYGALSLLCAILTLLPLNGYLQVGIFTVSWIALQFCYDLGPIVLCKSGDARIVERLIPAAAAEKLALRLIYFLAVTAIAVFLLPEAALLIYRAWPAIQTSELMMLVDIRFNNPISLRILNLFGAIATVLTCLYFVTKPRTGRFVKGFVSVIVFQIILGTVGAIYGIIFALKKGFEDGYAGKEPDPCSPAELSTQAVESLTANHSFTWGLSIALAIYIVIMVRLNYKALKHSNL